MKTTEPQSQVRVLDYGTLSADRPLTPERAAALSAEAARLGYDLAKVTIGDDTVYLIARPHGTPSAAHLAGALVRAIIGARGLAHQPALPARPQLFGAVDAKGGGQ
jgi:hypothetical protein